MKATILRTVFLLCLSTCCAWQTPATQVDSLMAVAQKESDPYKRTDLELEALQVYLRQDVDSATLYIDRLLAEKEEAGFLYGIARTKSLRAWAMFHKTEYEEALKLGHEALKIQLTIKDTLGVASTLNRIGVANLTFKRFADAEKYLNRSLAIFTRLRDSSRMDMLLNNLGVLELEVNAPEKAIVFFKRSLAMRTAQNDFFWIAYALFNIGEAFQKTTYTDSATWYLEQSYHTFREKTASGYVPSMVNSGMASLYHLKGKNREALEYAQTALADATEKGHTEIVLEVKPVLASIYADLNRYKEAYEMQKEYLLQQNEFDSVNNEARVAEVEARYKTAEREAEIAKLKTEKLEAENNTQRTRFYATVGGAFLFILLLTTLFFLLRRNQQAHIRRSELDRKIAETKMLALRAQMNPHFIFNCINTAQGFVINNDRENAHIYLTDFARLLRMVLENSSGSFIAIEQEIELLQLYVKLEATRFNRRFTCDFQIDPALENGVYEIPGMIIQPLVENAIGHGLINQQGNEGVLNISFQLQGDFICCEITDNGVGRKKAEEIKSGKANRYQSAAIPNIKERLELLRGETGHQVEISITDLEVNGEATGTCVRVMLPWQ